MNRNRTILVTIGIMLSLFMASMEATVVATAMPIIAENTPDILEQVLAFPPYLLVVFLLGFGGGFILLGIVIFQSDKLPRWSGILLIIGVILFIISEMELFDRQLSHYLVTIGDTLFGAGLSWVGFSLWKE